MWPNVKGFLLVTLLSVRLSVILQWFWTTWLQVRTFRKHSIQMTTPSLSSRRRQKDLDDLWLRAAGLWGWSSKGGALRQSRDTCVWVDSPPHSNFPLKLLWGGLNGFLNHLKLISCSLSDLKYKQKINTMQPLSVRVTSYSLFCFCFFVCFIFNILKHWQGFGC